ncbi:MAG: hypothetical protein ABIP71_14325 [Verrucomicrobiota bacterium]
MNTKGLLTFSLIANLALAGTVVYLVKNKEAGDAPFVAQAPNNSLSKPGSVTKLPAGVKIVGKIETNTSVPQINWRMVESDDYRKYIENLRSIGCPEETIRDIITADVNKLFDARRKELRAASTNKFEFWKAGNMFAGMMDEEKIKQKQELSKEKRELLKTLLGVEPEEKPDMASLMGPMEDMLDFLPEGKQAKMIELMQSMQSKMMKSMKDGAPDAGDMKAMQKVQKEMETEMAKILTPQEFEDYQLRLSQTSMMMRMQLSSFDPNEKEFRDIFKLQKEFDDEYGAMGMFGISDDKDKATKARTEMHEQVKTILGTERYADYERAQDHAYQGIAKVAQREGLPKEAGIKVYDMKKAAEAEANKVRTDSKLSEEQRTAALEAIRKETERSMGEVLGPKAMESYQKQPTAYWLRSISPNPKSAVK